ncbi:YybH family protein [Solimonas soli]|uniref:YybH family protein n=1 Tax=Solimonas soli TaxID=413479 RepID=UPI0004B57763|nr:nuclear transport factor 2 family protein [Solimonas soli]
MDPTAVTERYFASIRARDLDALVHIYADDASFTLPNGKQFAGVAAIRELHRSVFAAGGPVPTPVARVVGHHSIAVEIEARLPDGSVRHTANFYELNAQGRIQRLSVYCKSLIDKPGPSPQPATDTVSNADPARAMALCEKQKARSRGLGVFTNV